MKLFNINKKTLCIILLTALLLGVGGVLAYCKLTNNFDIETGRDRFVYLIEESKKVNEIFFGEGLPVYERDGELDGENGIYIGQSNPGYELVMEVSEYYGIDDMKRHAQRVYSSDYCYQIFQSAFDGVIYDGVTVLEYSEIGGKLYQSSAHEPLIKREKIYLYDTMKTVRPSTSSYVNIEISAYYEDKPNEIFTERLGFILEDGNFYLDTPTY